MTAQDRQECFSVELHAVRQVELADVDNRGQKIDVSPDTIYRPPAVEPARLLHKARHANSAFVEPSLAAAQTTVVALLGGAIVGQKDNQRVVAQVQLIESGQQASEVSVHILEHAVHACHVLDKAALFRDLPYDAYSVLCPWYQVMTQPQLTDFFTRLADELPKPLILYNAPWADNMLSFDHLRRLAEHPRIIGAKDVTTQYTRLLTWPTEQRQAVDFSYMIGAPLITTAAALGADGCVTALAGVFPELCVSTWHSAVQGDHALAAQYQGQLMTLMTALKLGPPIACLEAMVRHRGTGQFITAHPRTQLDESTVARIVDVVQNSGALPGESPEKWTPALSNKLKGGQRVAATGDED